MVRTITFGSLALLSGCAVAPSSAPVSAAAIATYEVINLRQLPIPKDVTSVYFERPATEQELGEAKFQCFLVKAEKFAQPTRPGITPEAARGEQGLRIPPLSDKSPACPTTQLALSNHRRLRYFDKDQEKLLLGFLENVRGGWSTGSVLQSAHQSDAVVLHHYQGRVGRQYALHVVGVDGTLTIVIQKNFLEYVNVQDRKRAVRGLNIEEIRQLQSMGIYPFRT